MIKIEWNKKMQYVPKGMAVELCSNCKNVARIKSFGALTDGIFW